MRTLLTNLATVLASILCCPFSQTSAQRPQANPIPQSEDSDVVRISVRLVQVDGTVTDKQGHQVTDLTKDDFQLSVDGQSRNISTFYYIPAQPSSRTEIVKTKNDPVPVAPPTPTGRLRED